MKHNQPFRLNFPPIFAVIFVVLVAQMAFTILLVSIIAKTVALLFAIPAIFVTLLGLCVLFGPARNGRAA